MTLTWYDGGKTAAEAARPPRRRPALRQRHLLRRRQGDARLRRLVGPADPLPGGPPQGIPAPAPTIPRSIGHRPEWIKACKDRKPEDAKAGFAYSGPFTEALLVGNLALRLQKRIEWDAAGMRAPERPRGGRLIHKRYREGFGIAT